MKVTILAQEQQQTTTVTVMNKKCYNNAINVKHRVWEKKYYKT